MSDEQFTGVRPGFEVLICGAVVYRASTRQEAELALKEALEIHHPAYPLESLSNANSRSAAGFLASNHR